VVIGLRRKAAYWLRGAALLLLCVISTDGALDANCDPLPQARDGVTIGMRAAGTQEPCAPECTPDCFCCSRSLAARPAFSLPGGGTAAQTTEPAAPAVPQGVRPVPYRPPLTILA
jgi:hypothetical protein